EIEFLVAQRQRQTWNAPGIESKVVAVVENPVGLRIFALALLDCVTRQVKTPVITRFDPCGAQQSAPVAAEVKHLASRPMWVFQLQIEIREPLRRGRNERHRLS